jgi:hypothetical protein
MHPMRKLLLSTFEEWFYFSPYSASARVLVFPLSCPFSLCRSFLQNKTFIRPTTQQQQKQKIKTTTTTALSVSPTLPFSQEKTHQKWNYIQQEQQKHTQKSNYYYYQKNTEKN